MKVMVSEGIGTNEVERYRLRQSERKFGEGRGVVNRDKIGEDMQEKLRDSIEWEGKQRKERGQLRRQLEECVGNRSRRYKKFINMVRDTVRVEKQKLERKNKEKSKNLRSKIKREEFELPASLSRYREAKIFTEEGDSMEPEPLKGPVIVGDPRELLLSADEKAILTRGPKFTIRRVLNKENFVREMEKTWIKERWRLIQEGEEENEEEE